MVFVGARAGRVPAAHEQAIFAVQELGLQEAEAGVLQVVHAQELGAADDLADVVPAEQQLGGVGELQQRPEAPGRDLQHKQGKGL